MHFDSVGKVPNAVHYSNCGQYIIYPLGSFIVLKNIATGKESFLDGHTSEISCVVKSHDGTLLASGQSNIAGIKVTNSIPSFFNQIKF